LPQCAGVGCGLVRVVAGEERARKVFCLEGPPGYGETSRLGSRDPVDGGTSAGHMVARRARRSRGRSSWCKVAVEQEAWREAGPSTRGLVVCQQNHRRTVSWFGPQNQVRRPNTRRDRMACVGRTRGAAKAWPSDGKTHKHYINAPLWVVSQVVELGVTRVISHTGGARYISHECVWMAPSLRDLGFHSPPPFHFLFFLDHFVLLFL
jgi:hypothetical protein